MKVLISHYPVQYSFKFANLEGETLNSNFLIDKFKEFCFFLTVRIFLFCDLPICILCSFIYWIFDLFLIHF